MSELGGGENGLQGSSSRDQDERQISGRTPVYAYQPQQQEGRPSLLDEVLREKILALMQSPEVVPWLQQQQQQLKTQQKQQLAKQEQHL